MSAQQGTCSVPEGGPLGDGPVVQNITEDNHFKQAYKHDIQKYIQ